MKAIQFDRLGGPEVLEPREVPLPELAPGDVLVRNRAIAVNFGDLFFIDGRYLVKPVFPDVPGMEAAGVIEAVGPRVDGLTRGMRVMYIGMGAFAEYTRIRRSRVMPLPDDIDFETAAAFPIAVLTAWHLMLEHEWKKELGIPKDMNTYAVIPIGWPRGKFGPVSRRPAAEAIHRERW